MNSEQILSRAAEIMDEERRGIELTRRALDARFLDAVSMIRSCRGKLVVSGVGKSGLVGQKIVASLNSLGTTAVFMHGADGVHGDLGVVGRNDVVLLLSFSGRTFEVLANLASIKKIGARIIAMVGDSDSPLARAADAVLPVAIRREACAFNMAPTSSTAAMMALGDALAVILSELRGFQAEDFAVYHPGGALGRRLLLRVRDIMPPGEHPVATARAPVTEIVDLLTRAPLGAVSIVRDRRGRKLEGLITDGDVRRALAMREKFFTMKAGDVMTRSPITIGADTLAAEALNLMENRARQISVLPVVDARGRALGLVRVHDLLQFGGEGAKKRPAGDGPARKR